MRLRSTTGRPSRRLLGVVGVAAAALLATTLGPGSTSPATPPAAAAADAAPDLLKAVPKAAASSAAGPAGVQGKHQLVTVDTSILPRTAAAGRQLRLPIAGGQATIDLTSVEQERGFTSWQGTIAGQPLGSFTLVQAGSVLRGGLNAPGMVYALTDAGDGRYWWTEVSPPQLTGDESDAVTLPAPKAAAPAAASAPKATTAAAKPKRRGKVKIGVLFGFTKKAKAELGSRAAVKAAAALVVAQTNQSMKNSRVKVKVKLRGVIKAKGKESNNLARTLKRVYKPRDGKFDNLLKKRKRKRADLVQVLQGGQPTTFCGIGFLPRRPAEARLVLGSSVTLVSCLPILTATHEIGHNLGADHNKYPGVSHSSRVKGSFGFVNPPLSYITVMSYYNPCADVGIYTCVAIPWFSSPKNTFNGQPLGTSKRQNNSKVIRMTAPRVARYVR